MTRPKKPNQARIRKNGAIDWDQQMRFDMEYAKRTILERGQMAPMFVMHTKTGLQVYLTPFADERAKVAVFRLIGLTVLAENAEGLTFMGEFWMRKLPAVPGETPAEARERSKQGPTPRDAEDRIEVVLIQTTYRDQATGERHVINEMREILRGADGKVSGLAATGTGGHDRMEGRIVEIFPEDAPSEAIRHAAAIILAEYKKKFALDFQHIMRGGHA
jgi:hypothetical protein